MQTMLRSRMTLCAAVGALALLAPTAAVAGKGNPGGTGPPGQSCQEIEAAGGRTPGNAANSPGSPFNEPEINSEKGGTGGQNYSEGSQYDVACFHVSSH